MNATEREDLCLRLISRFMRGMDGLGRALDQMDAGDALIDPNGVAYVFRQVTIAHQAFDLFRRDFPILLEKLMPEVSWLSSNLHVDTDDAFREADQVAGS